MLIVVREAVLPTTPFGEKRSNQMPKTILCPESLKFQPRPTYPYSPGTKGEGMIFTAGQVAWDETGDVVGIGDAAEQTRQTLKNVVSVLKKAVRP